jgi:hypothetical protein
LHTIYPLVIRRKDRTQPGRTDHQTRDARERFHDMPSRGGGNCERMYEKEIDTDKYSADERSRRRAPAEYPFSHGG